MTIQRIVPRILSACCSTTLFLFLLAPPAALAYVDPVSGSPSPGQVLRGFDPPAQRWLTGHRGVDLALAVGSPVRAADDGRVAFAGVVAGKPVVSIDHADGIRTTYEPVHARVRRGEAVTAGQVIGTLGHPHDGKPGLHWGARSGSEDYLDPLSLLGQPVIRLKPL